MIALLLLGALWVEPRPPAVELDPAFLLAITKVKEVVEHLPEDEQESPCISLAAVYASAGKYEEACRLARKVGDPDWRQATFEAIAMTRARRKDFAGALDAAFLAGPESDVVKEITLLQGRAGQLAAAEANVAWIDHSIPRARALLGLADLHRQAGHPEASRRLADRAVAAVSRFHERAEVKPLLAHGALLQDQRTRWETLVKEVQGLDDPNDRDQGLTDLSVAAARVGLVAEAQQLARQVTEDGVFFDRDEAFLAVGRALLDRGDDRSVLAMALAARPGETAWRDDLLLDLVRLNLKARRPAKALVLAGQLETSSDQVETPLEIAEAMRRDGSANAEVSALLDRAAATARKEGDPTDRHRLLYRAALLAKVARAQVQGGERKKAAALVDEAMALVRRPDVDPGHDLFFDDAIEEITAGALALGDQERAVELLKFAWDRAIKSEPPNMVNHTLSALSQIARCFVRTDQVPLVLDLASRLGDETFTYGVIAEEQGRSGRFRVVPSWVSDKVEASHRLSVMIHFLRGMIEHRGLIYESPGDRVRTGPDGGMACLF